METHQTAVLVSGFNFAPVASSRTWLAAVVSEEINSDNNNEATKISLLASKDTYEFSENKNNNDNQGSSRSGTNNNRIAAKFEGVTNSIKKGIIRMDASELRSLSKLLDKSCISSKFEDVTNSFARSVKDRHDEVSDIGRFLDNNTKKIGSNIGDATNSIKKRINDIDMSYEFDEISRVLDNHNARIGSKFGDVSNSINRGMTDLGQQAQSRVQQITGKEQYQFGDITRTFIANYTGKESYTLGDITGEVKRRVATGEYELMDVVLVIRILLYLGVSITPIASILPIQTLVELLSVGLEQAIGLRFLQAVAQSLDKRLKQALLDEKDDHLLDNVDIITKDHLVQTISKVTGKESYQSGDINRLITDTQSIIRQQGASAQEAAMKALASVGKDLDSWDAKFRMLQKLRNGN